MSDILPVFPIRLFIPLGLHYETATEVIPLGDGFEARMNKNEVWSPRNDGQGGITSYGGRWGFDITFAAIEHANADPTKEVNKLWQFFSDRHGNQEEFWFYNPLQAASIDLTGASPIGRYRVRFKDNFATLENFAMRLHRGALTLIEVRETIFRSQTFSPDISYGFIFKNRFVAIVSDNTVLMTQETVAGGGIYPAWSQQTVPPGPWLRVSNERDQSSWYLTRNDTGIAVQYPTNPPPLDSPWTSVTTSNSVKGIVLNWGNAPPGVANLNKLLQANESGFIEETTGAGPFDQYLNWTAQSALPITAEWAVQIPGNHPLFSSGSFLIIPKMSGNYIYTDNPPGSYSTGVMLSGDWRAGQVMPTLGGPFGATYMVVGASGGENLIGYLSVYNGTWVAMTPPAGYVPADPRIICWYQGGIVNPAADATWIAIAGGPCDHPIIYSEVVAGVPGAWTVMPNIPNIPGAIWTGIDWQWNKNPGNHILIVGTDGVNPLLLVSNDAFNSPPITWTQKSFTVSPF